MASKITRYRIHLVDSLTLKQLIKNEFYDIEDGDDEWVEYMWTEGNMACDCNRAKHFGIEDYPCGDDRFYLIGVERMGPGKRKFIVGVKKWAKKAELSERGTRSGLEEEPLH